MVGANFSESLQINLVLFLRFVVRPITDSDHESIGDDDGAPGECQDPFAMRPSEYMDRSDPKVTEETRVLEDARKDASYVPIS